MSDVRALLKAKRQEARINHPLASYTSTGQLRCIVCQTNIKHASAWEGHLCSKGHRTNTARLREEERLREQEEEEKVALSKRKAEESPSVEIASKKQKTSGPSTPTPRATAPDFPSDFFSDPSQSLPPPLSDDSDEEPVSVEQPQKQVADSVLDQEWLRFQQTVVNAPDERETYDRATIFAEPQLVSRTAEGFPSTKEDEVQAESELPLDEEGLRRRKEQEERELIMDRLLDEERAQEEADMKVTMMKNRLEALRRKREAARSTKAKSATS